MKLRLSRFTAAGLLLACLSGCQPPASVPVETIEEEDDHILASVVETAGENAWMQLVKGFHGVEQNAWRWTMSRFAVTLAPPEGAAEKGATLELKFAVPGPVIEKLGAITLTPSLAGTALDPETYAKSGSYTLERDLPAELLAGDAVTVEFALDKFLPPGEVDQRELGVIVSSVGLVAK